MAYVFIYIFGLPPTQDQDATVTNEGLGWDSVRISEPKNVSCHLALRSFIFGHLQGVYKL